MKKTPSYLLYLILPLFITSCHSILEDTFVKLPPTPVLNAVLHPDSLIQVHLSFTSGLNDTILSFIESADVEIHSTEGWVEKLTSVGNGWYTSSRISIIGETYTCYAHIEGFPPLKASSTVPPITEVENITFIPTASKNEEGRDICSIHFPIVNYPDKQLFWEVRMLREGLQYDWDSQRRMVKTREVYIDMQAGIDPVLQNEALPLTVFSNRKITGEHYEVVFYFSSSSIGGYSDEGLEIDKDDNFHIELRSTDESYYWYQKQFYLYETSGGTGFGSSTQSYPLYSNVENGLGVFTSFSKVIKKLELKFK